MMEWSEKEQEGIDRLKELVEAYSAECRNREKGCEISKCARESEG